MCLNSTASDASGISVVESWIQLLLSGLTSVSIVDSYPVAEDASTSVGGLDVSDIWEVNLFGKKQQKQTLHPHRCDLDINGEIYINFLSSLFYFMLFVLST